ncbi:hypothetical protein CHS0354_033374 [Potamilus streckersoni]|uniref:MULE transposase domain-containing protein n=1 Tax=Potamilus streckersoni TaxID=2493646 RepID=A0AAE0RTG5_9BIVA|nr:hypothetical protein CHS0354_033374 [Potamilus streckersoni]
MVDFELAAIRTFQNTFLAATLTGFMFHFGQWVWRKLQMEVFSKCYRNEPDYALIVKRLLSLAFVPPQDVIDLFEDLIEDPAYHDIDVICDYMEDNFIGRLRRARRGPPRFSIQLCSQFSRVINNLPHSNNAIEGWHNAFNNVLGFTHPIMTKLARKLQQEQHSTQLLRQLELETWAGKKKKTHLRQRGITHYGD